MKCKITFIGGGSLRTLTVIRDWVMQENLAEDSTITIHDIDMGRANTIATLAMLMPEMKNRNVIVSAESNFEKAIDGADFVYNVTRIGGIQIMERDKRIGLKYGFHGHDDFGPSAAMIVLRSIPFVLELAKKMETYCPNAWLLNFSNPVPFLVRAVTDFSSIKTIGLCGGDGNQLYDIPELLGWDKKPCKELSYQGAGIDHFSWSTELKYKGRDFYPEFIETALKINRSGLPYYLRMSVEVLEIYGQWLSSSAHCFHWTHHDELTLMMKEYFDGVDKGSLDSRTATQNCDMDKAADLAMSGNSENFWSHPSLNKYFSLHEVSLGVRFISSLLENKEEEMMVSLKIPGAMPYLQDDGIVLVSVKVTEKGPQPVELAPIPDKIIPLTRQILDYQRFLVHAAVYGCRKDLEAALMTDPNIRDVGKMRNMLNELLESNRDYIRPELFSY